MHKNFLWQAFLLVIFCATLWYSAVALYSYYSYSQLKTQIAVSSIQWEVEEKSEDNYLIKALYQFKYRNNPYSGSTTLSDIPYRNQWAAQQAIKEYSKKNWKTWFDPQNPNHSSLQKNFPLKECISAIFLWGLTIYFLWLGFYVAKFKS